MAYTCYDTRPHWPLIMYMLDIYILHAFECIQNSYYYKWFGWIVVSDYWMICDLIFDVIKSSVCSG